MKTSGLMKIPGKRIKGVIVKQANSSLHSPMMAIFLVFDDDTHFEFYSTYGDILFTSNVYAGGLAKVERYGAEALDIVFEASLDESDRGVVTND